MAEKRKRKVNSPPDPGGITKKRPCTTSTDLPKHESKPESPTSEDWKFRLKVICARNIDDEVFDDAIQGLVKICFPDSVLDELGVDIVTRHMDQESAPEANIGKMQQIFQSAMIKKVAWMLAGYLNTPTKFHTAVASIMTAVQELHGYLPPATLDSEDHIEMTEKSLTAVDSSGSFTSHGQSNHQKSPKHEDGSFDHRNLQVNADDTSSTFTIEQPNMEALVSHGPSDLQKNGPRKVSNSWRWAIHPNSVTLDNVQDHFKKPKDLFAFHALPIVNHELGHDAERKEKRRAINYRLAAMSCEEFKEWEDSFDKLRKGDLTMLDRIKESLPGNNADDHVTPAPVAFQQHEAKHDIVNAKNGRRLSTDGVEINAGKEVIRPSAIDALKQVHVKAEDNCESARISNSAMQQEVNDKLPVTAISSSVDKPFSELTSKPRCMTPIVDLFWGKSSFAQASPKSVTDKIFGELDKRVTTASISYEFLDGIVYHVTKKRLRSKLTCCIRSAQTQTTNRRKRAYTEHCLQPWVFAHPDMFPELREFSLFFVGFKPTSLKMDDGAKDMLLSALVQRGILPDVSCGKGVQPLEACIKETLHDRSRRAIERRSRIELALREVAFAHKDKFPDLSSSSLVKAWENTTGSKWI
ncbi:hypothetical protein DM02DRAFT_705928 [Periconia macrospinosa]|uniref:Uncharacterized protein n=1 Tax=Periconia macrospinosa TaxID=97972 RepID=A0A2V1DWV9_9PLEO|nr:hypothetical protein DM02DRAFT_705928 [Periconia macrospinosa]